MIFADEVFTGPNMFIGCIIIITIINCCSVRAYVPVCVCAKVGSFYRGAHVPFIVIVWTVHTRILCKWRIDGVKPVTVVVDTHTHACAQTRKSNWLCRRRELHTQYDQRGVFGQMHAHAHKHTQARAAFLKHVPFEVDATYAFTYYYLTRYATAARKHRGEK